MLVNYIFAKETYKNIYMKLTINNFGPVKGKQDYTIDLSKNFTLVTGGNGLGKTYLGYILYGFIKRFKDSQFITSSSNTFKNPNIIVTSIEKQIDVTISKSDIESYTNSIIEFYKKNIHIYMGIDKRSADMLFKDLSIDVNNIEEIYNDFINKELERSLILKTGDVISFSKEHESDIINISSLTIDISEDIATRKVALSYIGMFINDQLLEKSLINRIFYLPVERNSLYTFSKELSLKRSDMIDQMQSLLLDKEHDVPAYLRKNASRYPEAIEDALKQAQDLTQLTKNEAEQDYVKLADDIEQEILQGRILINSEGEVEFSPSSNKRKKVPVHLSASFIKTISSIVFFLKHIASKGDMLMIDEPEMNLHPTLQITFARILANISNSGIKIWMSTHSDYIISELNNLTLVGILNAKGKKEETQRWGYSGSYFLDKENMQALYLNDAKAKTQVKIENLEIKDYGVDITSIDNCLNDLNERTNELFELYDNL